MIYSDVISVVHIGGCPILSSINILLSDRTYSVIVAMHITVRCSREAGHHRK